jgi:hypothetical protein
MLVLWTVNKNDNAYKYNMKHPYLIWIAIAHMYMYTNEYMYTLESMEIFLRATIFLFP